MLLFSIELVKSADFTEELIKTYNENRDIGYFWKMECNILKSGVIAQ